MRKLLFLLALLVFVGYLPAQFQPLVDFSAKAQEPTKTLEESFAEVSVVARDSIVAPGSESALAIILDVSKTGHFYANPNPEGIGLPTELAVADIEGIEFLAPVYPPGKSYIDPLSEMEDLIYEGETIIYLPFRVNDSYSQGDIVFDLSLRGLFCTDSQCIPWSDKAEFTLKVDPSGPTINNDSVDKFAGFDAAEIFPETADSTEPEQTSDTSLVIVNILFAMLAGLIMNVMPCVLPVIPLKVLSIIKQGQQARESGDNFRAFKLSLAFAAGIIFLFAVLGLIMSAFNLAYGQQFQSLTFRLVMFLIVYIMALSMFGLFEIVLPSGLSNLGVVKSGYFGSFMMGVMATLLATPCSAPFLGGVLVWTLNHSATMTLVIFICIGIGMSFPYVLLTAFPKLIDKVPAAGNWMVRLKEGFAFVMLAVAAFIATWFSGQQLAALLYLAVAVAFGLWLSFQVVNFMTAPFKRYLVRLIALIIVLAVGIVGFSNATAESDVDSMSVAEIIEAREQALADGRIVFMEFTADWCINCKYVEKAVLGTRDFQEKLVEKNAVFLEVDWTNYDQAATDELNRLGSKSVPFSAVFHPEDPDNPILLRDTYTLQSALNALDNNR